MAALIRFRSPAFFYAGARSLLVSHWKVPSKATVKLMTSTFAELAKNPNIGRAEALRRAEMMSRMAGSIGAVAFSRSGDPMIGEFGDAKLLRKFGNVPDDLSGL